MCLICSLGCGLKKFKDVSVIKNKCRTTFEFSLQFQSYNCLFISSIRLSFIDQRLELMTRLIIRYVDKEIKPCRIYCYFVNPYPSTKQQSIVALRGSRTVPGVDTSRRPRRHGLSWGSTLVTQLFAKQTLLLSYSEIKFEKAVFTFRTKERMYFIWLILSILAVSRPREWHCRYAEDETIFNFVAY